MSDKKKDEFEDEFEELLSEVLNEEYQPQEPPSSKESFNRMKPYLIKRKKRKQRRTMMKLAAVVMSSMLIGGIVFGDFQASAFHPDRWYQIYQQVKDEVVTFVFGKEQDESGAITPPPRPEMEEGSDQIPERENITLEEAREALIFPMLYPEYVPQEFKRTHVEIFYAPHHAGAAMLDISFENQNAESASLFFITQRWVDDDSVLSSSMNPESGEIQEIEINGNSAILIRYEDERTRLTMMIENLYVDIAGHISEDLIIEVAQSLVEY